MAKLVKDMAMLCPSLLSEFLSCVKNSCDTISVDQVEILSLFKTNILAIKSEVDTCLNKLIGRELELKFLKNGRKIEKHVKNENPLSCLEQLSYKNRIVIHGLSSLRNVRKEEAVGIVNSFFSSTLKIKVKVENVDVLKQKCNSVAIVSLSSIDDRRKIFGNCHRLKFFHERVSVTDDVPPKTRNSRKHLLKFAVAGNNVKYDSELGTDHLREAGSDELKISSDKTQCCNENNIAVENVGRKKEQKKRSAGNSKNREKKLTKNHNWNLELEEGPAEHMEGIYGGIGKMEEILGGMGKTERSLGGIGEMKGILGGMGKTEGSFGGIGKMEGILGGMGETEGSLGGKGKLEGIPGGKLEENLGGIRKMEGNLFTKVQVQGGNRKPEEKFGGNRGREVKGILERNEKTGKFPGNNSPECSEIVEAIEKCLREALGM